MKAYFWMRVLVCLRRIARANERTAAATELIAKRGERPKQGKLAELSAPTVDDWNLGYRERRERGEA